MDTLGWITQDASGKKQPESGGHVSSDDEAPVSSLAGAQSKPDSSSTLAAPPDFRGMAMFYRAAGRVARPTRDEMAYGIRLRSDARASESRYKDTRARKDGARSGCTPSAASRPDKQEVEDSDDDLPINALGDKRSSASKDSTRDKGADPDRQLPQDPVMEEQASGSEALTRKDGEGLEMSSHDVESASQQPAQSIASSSNSPTDEALQQAASRAQHHDHSPQQQDQPKDQQQKQQEQPHGVEDHQAPRTSPQDAKRVVRRIDRYMRRLVRGRNAEKKEKRPAKKEAERKQKKPKAKVPRSPQDKEAEDMVRRRERYLRKLEKKEKEQAQNETATQQKKANVEEQVDELAEFEDDDEASSDPIDSDVRVGQLEQHPPLQPSGSADESAMTSGSSRGEEQPAELTEREEKCDEAGSVEVDRNSGVDHLEQNHPLQPSRPAAEPEKCSISSRVEEQPDEFADSEEGNGEACRVEDGNDQMVGTVERNQPSQPSLPAEESAMSAASSCEGVLGNAAPGSPGSPGKAQAEGYYQIIDGELYNKKLLARADRLCECTPLQFEDVKRLWAAYIRDDPAAAEIQEVNLRTLELVARRCRMDKVAKLRLEAAVLEALKQMKEEQRSALGASGFRTNGQKGRKRLWSRMETDELDSAAAPGPKRARLSTQTKGRKALWAESQNAKAPSARNAGDKGSRRLGRKGKWAMLHNGETPQDEEATTMHANGTPNDRRRRGKEKWVHWNHRGRFRSWATRFRIAGRWHYKHFPLKKYMRTGMSEEEADRAAYNAAVAFKRKCDGEDDSPEEQAEAKSGGCRMQRCEMEGVRWHIRKGAWQVQMSAKGRKIHGGYFRPKDDSPEEAEKARLLAMECRRALQKRFRGTEESTKLNGDAQKPAKKYRRQQTSAKVKAKARARYSTSQRGGRPSQSSSTALSTAPEDVDPNVCPPANDDQTDGCDDSMAPALPTQEYGCDDSIASAPRAPEDGCDGVIDSVPPTPADLCDDMRASAPPIQEDGCDDLIGESAALEMAVCYVCGGSDATAENNLALCDWCDCGFHQMCHDPPVRSFGRPEEQWFCSACTQTISALRSLRHIAGELVWADVQLDGPECISTLWPARIISVGFTSVSDPTPYHVRLYDRPPIEGIWLSEAVLRPWCELPPDLSHPDLERAMRMAVEEEEARYREIGGVVGQPAVVTPSPACQPQTPLGVAGGAARSGVTDWCCETTPPKPANATVVVKREQT